MPLQSSCDALLAQLRSQAEMPPERAESLAPELYWRPDVYERELERVFRRDWSCVAHVSQLPRPGDWRRVDLAGEPLVIVRGAEGKLRALSRVCRHRALDLLCASESSHGSARSFECPYHLWNYGLDGRLLGAPEMRGAEGFERAQIRLPEFPLEVWQGYVFVCLDRAAEPLAPRLRELDELMRDVDMSDWVVSGSLPWPEYEANWKVAIENAAECYHHMGTHRDTLQPLWPANRVVLDETSSPDFIFARLVTSERAATAVEEGFPIQPILLPPRPGLTPEQRSQTLIAGVFPMFFFAVGPDSASWFDWLPTGPTRHRLAIHVLVPPASLEATGFDAGMKTQLEVLRRIQAEDALTNAGVQRGAASPWAERGRLSPLERPLWQFQRYLAARL